MYEGAPVLVPAVARHEVRARAFVLRLPAVASPALLLVSAEHVRAVGEGFHVLQLALGLLELLLEAHGEPVARCCCFVRVVELHSEGLDLLLPSV